MDSRKFIKSAVANLLAALLVLILLFSPAPAPSRVMHGLTGPTLAQEQAAYVDRKWGLFLHLNMATFLDVENAPTGVNPNTFNPSAINIDQWIATAVAAKVKYVTLTVKHIDGFALWPTASTAYNISNAAPFWTNSGHLNIANVFASKARAAGLIPQFYFSVQDEQITQFITQAQYRTYLELQLTELLTQNGPIGAIWIDRAQPAFSGTAFPWDSPDQLLAFIHGLQPQCLVVNNSKTNTFADTDIIVYEFAGAPPLGNTAPSEVVDTIRLDSNWFDKSFPSALQTAAQIESNLALYNSRGAAYMINAGPDATGNIPASEVAILTTVGASLP